MNRATSGSPHAVGAGDAMARRSSVPARPPRRSTHTRRWRALFVVYALVLTTLTHWPRLRLPATSPFGDKTIHMLAFALFTVLLWRTRWCSHLTVVMGIALAWSILDELAQGIPGLNRYVSAADAFANAMGVTVAAAWIAALAPPPPCSRPPVVRGLAHATAWTSLAAIVMAAAVIVLAYAHAQVVEAQLAPGVWPRLELLAAPVHPRLRSALTIAAIGILSALFVGRYRRARGTTGGRSIDG